MLSNKFHAELDKLWIEFWPATDIKPMSVIDFINLIFFARYLEETQEKEQATTFYSKALESPVYGENQEEMRWSAFKQLAKQELYILFNRKDNGLLDFIKNAAGYKKWWKFDRQAQTLVPTPDLLAGTVKLISSLEVADSTSRDEMNELLLKKTEAPAEPPQQQLVNTGFNSEIKKERFHVNDWKTSVVLLIIFISGFVGAFFYFGSRQNTGATIFKTAAAAGPNLVDDSTMAPVTQVLPIKKEKTTKSIKPSRNPEKKQQAVTKPKSAGAKKESIPAQKNDTGDVKEYKIISKAYFHNKPDESTRRNAFVTRWNNSYATIKPLDEKDGFVYVIFHNHLNQTSKGWLRKKDLREVE